jgi:hypothetical protein
MDMQQFITKKPSPHSLLLLLRFHGFIIITYYIMVHAQLTSIPFSVDSGMENFPLKGRCGEEHSLEQIL